MATGCNIERSSAFYFKSESPGCDSSTSTVILTPMLVTSPILTPEPDERVVEVAKKPLKLFRSLPSLMELNNHKKECLSSNKDLPELLTSAQGKDISLADVADPRQKYRVNEAFDRIKQIAKKDFMTLDLESRKIIFSEGNEVPKFITIEDLMLII